MKLSDYLVNEIYNITGTDKFFGYIGGMVSHIVDSIYKNKEVELVNNINEQSAGLSADGYARTCGKIGVAIATSGPGATNLVTPIADCYFDSVPVLFITGQVNTYEYNNFNIRQNAFQETNIVDIVKSITKYAKTITNSKDIKYELQKAVSIANSGRKGPVLLDIPMDVQRENINPLTLKEYRHKKESLKKFSFDFKLIEKAKSPLILVGNGIKISSSFKLLDKVLKKYNIPVVESLHGVDCVNSYKYNMGFIGTYGNRCGNLALYECDLLIVLGSRLDIRQTGGNLEFLKNKKIIHVDIDKAELDCPKFDKIKINTDLSLFLTELDNANLTLNIDSWQKRCIKLKQKFSNENKIYKLPYLILTQIFKTLKRNTVITTDVGQNQMWCAQCADMKKGQKMLTSGGLGAMGFSLPAAIGASFCSNNVVAVSGDGGFQMNIQELEVIKRRNLPVKIIVLNNNCLGMVRTFQELYFKNCYASTVFDYSAPDFEKVSQAYGIDAVTINSNKFNIKDIINLLKSDSPVLINLQFEQNTLVEPRLEFGNSIENASPQIDLSELNIKLKAQRNIPGGGNFSYNPISLWFKYSLRKLNFLGQFIII